MPILTSVPIVVFDQESFHAIDKVLTGYAFDIHNEMGRYLDERLYQAEMATRLQEQELVPVREMKITVTLDEFTQFYYVDVLIRGGVIVEIKTAETLTAAHRAQVLNYLYLCGLHHATLLNFRTARVQHEFVSTHLTPALRRDVSWDLNSWKPLCPGCKTLHGILQRALAEWGSGLHPTLYRDAITHFLGRETNVIREVEIASAHGIIGKQKVHTLAPDIGFSLTASVHHPDLVLEHHRRFLQHTPLRAIQWVNLNRQTVSLHTLMK
jgi:GxxExxY protein